MIYVILKTSTYSVSPEIIDGTQKPGYFTDEGRCDRAIQTLLERMKEGGLEIVQNASKEVWTASKDDLRIELRKVCLPPGAVSNPDSGESDNVFGLAWRKANQQQRDDRNDSRRSQ
jgi:hypothetical protein